MDPSSSSDLSDFSGYSASDRDGDYNDAYNGTLYNVVETRLGTCITITFLNQEAFEKVFAQLDAQYDFKLNKPQNGQTTTVKTGNGKVVITVYKSCKILLQGKEAKMWRNTVFRSVTSSLKIENKEGRANKEDSTTMTNSSPPCPDTPQLTKNKSTSFLSRVSKAILGPQMNSDFVKLGQEVKKAKKKAKKGYLQIDQEELSRQLKAIQTTGVKPKTKLHKTMVKSHSYSPYSYKSTSFKPQQFIFVPHQARKKQPQADKSEETSVKTVYENKEDGAKVETEQQERKTQPQADQSEETSVKIVDDSREDDTEIEIENCENLSVGTASETEDTASVTTVNKPESAKTSSKEQLLQNCNGIGENTKNSNTDQLQQNCSELKESTTNSNTEQLNQKCSEIRDLKMENEKLTLKNEEQARTIVKLVESAEKLKKTLTDTQVKASNQSKHITSLTAKVKEREEKEAAAVAETLKAEEELSNSKKSIDRLREEKQKLTNTISSKNNDKDQVKQLQTDISDLRDDFSSFRTENNNMKQKLETTVTLADLQIMKLELQNTLKKEIHEQISKQIEHFMCSTTSARGPESNSTVQRAINVETYVPQQPTCDDPAQRSSKSPEKETNTKKKSVYIIGDSVTKTLNSKRLSGDKYTVAIKTNPGALVKDITSKIKSLRQDNRFTTSDAIIVHAGINDISEAHAPIDIMGQYDDLVSTIKNVNSSAKIIVSSVLPTKRNDKLSTKCVAEINSRLKQKCSTDTQMHFMDNSPKFIVDDSVNKALYTDEVHLSSKGAAVLARNIMDTINKCLQTGYNSRPRQAGNFHGTSLQKTMGQHQRPRGQRPGPPRRQPTRQRGPQAWIPPWMRLVPKWDPPAQYY